MTLKPWTMWVVQAASTASATAPANKTETQNINGNEINDKMKLGMQTEAKQPGCYKTKNSYKRD